MEDTKGKEPKFSRNQHINFLANALMDSEEADVKLAGREEDPKRWVDLVIKTIKVEEDIPSDITMQEVIDSCDKKKLSIKMKEFLKNKGYKVG